MLGVRLNGRLLMSRWAVVAVDWEAPNVIEWFDVEAEAKDFADRMDGLALRSVAVPEGHPMVKT
jgi:hypothetical protein